MYKAILMAMLFSGAAKDQEPPLDLTQPEAMDAMVEIYKEQDLGNPDYFLPCFFDSAFDEKPPARAMWRQIRNRFDDLKDAPPLSDAERWPSYSVCGEQFRLCGTFRSWAEHQRQFNSTETDYWDAVLERAAWLNKLYWNIDDVNSTWRDHYSRRMALKAIRNLIGKEAYQLHHIPHPLPLEFFRRD